MMESSPSSEGAKGRNRHASLPVEGTGCPSEKVWVDKVEGKKVNTPWELLGSDSETFSSNLVLISPIQAALFLATNYIMSGKLISPSSDYS